MHSGAGSVLSEDILRDSDSDECGGLCDHYRFGICKIGNGKKAREPA